MAGVVSPEQAAWRQDRTPLARLALLSSLMARPLRACAPLHSILLSRGASSPTRTHDVHRIVPWWAPHTPPARYRFSILTSPECCPSFHVPPAVALDSVALQAPPKAELPAASRHAGQSCHVKRLEH